MPSSHRLASIIEEESVSGHVIIDVLIKTMQHIGDFGGLTGVQKKALVLQTLEYELELPESVESLIIAIIDVLIQVENGKLTFNKKISRSIYSCCISGRK